MKKGTITIICSLLFIGCAANNQNEKRLTLGTVQTHVVQGQNQAEILKTLGSPNIITKDSEGRGMDLRSYFKGKQFKRWCWFPVI